MKDVPVFVGVLKDRRDLRLLTTEGWYRVPVTHAPKRAIAYLAFYQPAIFGRAGKCIRYYARVRSSRIVQRRTLLPDEPDHPRARLPYVQFRLRPIRKLAKPIRNIVPRRVTFGYTTLQRLHTARDLLQLYDVVPIEQMIGDALAHAGISARAEVTVSSGQKRVRVDFAIACRRGILAIECDNAASHTRLTARARDRRKDAFLRRRGWTIVHLTERAIVTDLPRCIARIRVAIRKRGGQVIEKGLKK